MNSSQLQIWFVWHSTKYYKTTPTKHKALPTFKNLDILPSSFELTSLNKLKDLATLGLHSHMVQIEGIEECCSLKQGVPAQGLYSPPLLTDPQLSSFHSLLSSTQPLQASDFMIST